MYIGASVITVCEFIEFFLIALFKTFARRLSPKNKNVVNVQEYKK